MTGPVFLRRVARIEDVPNAHPDFFPREFPFLFPVHLHGLRRVDRGGQGEDDNTKGGILLDVASKFY